MGETTGSGLEEFAGMKQDFGCGAEVVAAGEMGDFLGPCHVIQRITGVVR